MKVNFIIPSPGKTGGVVVVLEYAARLAKAGHDVRVYAPLLPYTAYFPFHPVPVRILRYLVNIPFTIRTVLRGFHWSGGTQKLTGVPWIGAAFVRDADATIATAWPTAFSVARLPESKGAKFYFIQHYEDWHGNVDRLDASYRLPLHLVTIAPWLTELMRARFHREVTAELHNGIDLAAFHPPAQRPAGPPSILMMHHVLDIKGTPDGLYVLRRIHALFPEAKIRMFGMYPFEDRDDFIEYFREPSRARLLELYQQSDVFLAPSLSEGWHLPPMEAMACGCALVATRVGCIPVLEGGGNMLTCEPGDREALLSHLTSLLRDPALLAETARKGRETILEYSWDLKGPQLEKVLRSVLAEARTGART